MAEFSDGLLSVQDAARFLNVCRRTIYYLMNSGDLVFSQIGGRRKIPRKALQRLAAKGVPEPGPAREKVRVGGGAP